MEDAAVQYKLLDRKRKKVTSAVAVADRVQRNRVNGNITTQRKAVRKINKDQPWKT